MLLCFYCIDSTSFNKITPLKYIYYQYLKSNFIVIVSYVKTISENVLIIPKFIL